MTPKPQPPQPKLKPSQHLPIFLYLSMSLIVLGVIAAVASMWVNLRPGVSPDFLSDRKVAFLCFALLCYLIHFLPLALLPARLARSLVTVMTAVILTAVIVGALLAAVGYGVEQNPGNRSSMIVGPLFALAIAFFWIHYLLVFSIPCTFLSSLPFLIFYLFIGLATTNPVSVVLFLPLYLPLAGFFFPRHRRLAEYWRPTRLPRIETPKPAAN